MVSYYIVPWAGMWHVYRGEDPVPVAAHASRECAEHWCRSDGGGREVRIYHGSWGPRRISA